MLLAVLPSVSMYFQIDPAESKEHPPNTVDVFDIFPGRIGIVEAHVTDTTKTCGQRQVERHGLWRNLKCGSRSVRVENGCEFGDTVAIIIIIAL
jgi:hypothetical protein